MIVVGLSSGTSTDGIDVAAARLNLDGALVRLSPLGFRTVEYTPRLRRAVRAALPPSPTTMHDVCELDTRIGQEFAAAAQHGIRELAGGRADLVASHGQTVYHWVNDGAVRGSLQLGQPAWIAEATGAPVVSDLRASDVAAGGQGAPLASLLDVLLLGGHAQPAAALNLGGIANVTVVRDDGPPVAFDTGPGNALLDTAARRVTGGHAAHDRDGGIARSGRVEPALLDRMLDEPYYRLPPPKTTGLELFGAGYLDAALAHGAPTDGDLLATLVELTAITVADALRPYGVAELLASGGGTHNPVLLDRLAHHVHPTRISAPDDLGLESDAKEAYLFALLGFLTWHGVPGTVPSCTGAHRATPAGRITPGAAPLRMPDPATTTPDRLRIDSPVR